MFSGTFPFLIKRLQIYTADSAGTPNSTAICFPRFEEKYVENIPHFLSNTQAIKSMPY